MLRARGHLRRPQTEDQAILVGGPHRPIPSQERRAGTFLAGESERAADQTIDEPFESDRRLDQLAAEFVRDAVDDRAGDDGLADRTGLAPLRAMLEQIG